MGGATRGTSAFARAGAQFAVCEVGMGGRLDATNILMPEVAIITQIDFDHENYLGHSIEEIAAEKAGIIKPGARVVSARPLRVDEELRFDLELPPGGRHLSGTARVLRQHRPDMYALRFENVAPAGRDVLGEFVDASSGGRAG